MYVLIFFVAPLLYAIFAVWATCYLVVKTHLITKLAVRILARTFLFSLLWGVVPIGTQGFALPGPALLGLVMMIGSEWYLYVLKWFGCSFFIMLAIVLSVEAFNRALGETSSVGEAADVKVQDKI